MRPALFAERSMTRLEFNSRNRRLAMAAYRTSRIGHDAQGREAAMVNGRSASVRPGPGDGSRRPMRRAPRAEGYTPSAPGCPVAIGSLLRDRASDHLPRVPGAVIVPDAIPRSRPAHLRGTSPMDRPQPRQVEQPEVELERSKPESGPSMRADGLDAAPRLSDVVQAARPLAWPTLRARAVGPSRPRCRGAARDVARLRRAAVRERLPASDRPGRARAGRHASPPRSTARRLRACAPAIARYPLVAD